MIELRVKDYCQDCPHFNPKIDMLYENFKPHTIISCEDEIRCSNIEARIKEKLKKEQNNDQD